jgi:acyl carrier protein
MMELSQGSNIWMATDMSQGDLEKRVVRVIAETQKIPIETVTIDRTFEDLKIDSLDGINIVFGLENEFGVSIPDEGIENMRSVRDAVEGVRTLLEQKASTAPTA